MACFGIMRRIQKPAIYDHSVHLLICNYSIKTVTRVGLPLPTEMTGINPPRLLLKKQSPSSIMLISVIQKHGCHRILPYKRDRLPGKVPLPMKDQACINSGLPTPDI